MVVLLVLLLVSALAVWLIVRSEAKSDPPKTPACVPASGSPASIKLRVLNATSREGLANTVATQLRQRGYTVTGVGNNSSNVPGTAEIRHGSAGAPAARAVAGNVAGATTRNDKRAGSEVDLVLGTKFRALAPAKPGVAASGCPVTAKPTGSPQP